MPAGTWPITHAEKTLLPISSPSEHHLSGHTSIRCHPIGRVCGDLVGKNADQKRCEGHEHRRCEGAGATGDEHQQKTQCEHGDRPM